MEINGNYENQLKSIGNLWKSMEIHGNPQEINGDPLKSWEIHWESMISMKINENLWTFMNFNRNQ